MRIYGLFASIALATLVSASASATVRYTFAAYSYPELNGENINGGGFSFEIYDFLSSDTTLQKSDLISCSVSTNVQPVGGACISQDLYISPFYNYIIFGINTTLNPLTYVSYYFDVGSFGSAGTYHTVLPSSAHAGQLIVEELAGPVPESATWAMMLAGFGAVGFAMRRRRAIISFT